MTKTHSPDRDALKLLGQSVRSRLALDETVYTLPVEDAEIFAVGDFATSAECDRLMAMIDEVARPSDISVGSYKDAFRTSYSGDFDSGNPFVRRISRRFDDLLGIDPAWGETIQGQRYLPGQQFKPHCDWFDTRAEYWKAEAAGGGQRSWTAMLFLNEVEQGGATEFTELGVTVEPTPGTVLIWNNANVDGEVNWATMHAGTPVVRGVKYVITKWYRTRSWQ